jgi:hypothetical protein
MINLSHVPAYHKKKILAPEAARCPRCGSWAPRNESRRRHFWEANLHQTTILDVTYGCYICPNCPEEGERWFTVLPYDLDTLGQYTRTTRRLVVEMVRQFKMSIEGAAEYGRTVLHLDMLNMTTVLDWLRQQADQIDVEARQQELLKAFSGQMDVDEVYDDHYYQLKATDPLNDLELAWEVGEGSPDKDDIRNFFEKLKAAGFYPKLVTTDGSELYPEVITEVWPEAKHQRCVFHFMMQVNKALAPVFWALYHTMPQPPKRKRGRPKKRGRPRKDKEKRENRRKVRKARFLIFKRKAPPGQRGRWTEAELATLDEALSLCPKLGVLRRLIEALHELFGPTTDSHELAEQRRAAIRQDAEIAQLPEITKFLELLGDDDLFARLTRYLDFDCAEKTSNHVERENREYRKRQKGFYRLRSRESICALLGMLTIRKPVPSKPRKLKLRSQDTAAWKEVSTAA